MKWFCWLYLAMIFSIHWGGVCNRVRSSQDESQHLQVGRHSSLPENSGLIELKYLRLATIFDKLVVLWTSDKDPSWASSIWGFPYMSNCEETPRWTLSLKKRRKVHLIWPKNTLVFPKRNWKKTIGKGISGVSCSACSHSDPTLDELTNMHGWMSGWIDTCFCVTHFQCWLTESLFNQSEMLP